MLDIYICFEYNMNMMNIVKRIRLNFLLISLFSLIEGMVIYIFWRQGTYIHLFLPKNVLAVLTSTYENIPDSILIDFLRYYFVDFLWCISLNFALYSVSDFKKRSAVIIIPIVSAVAGLLFEVAQYLDIVTGTFDIADIVMYIVASLCAVMINIKILKRMD